MGDFLRCPRLYYLRNVYKNPLTGRKINVVSPALSLGLAVHGTLESLLAVPAAQRFSQSLSIRFDEQWRQVTGKLGGFVGEASESDTRSRGLAMIERVERSPGPLKNKTIRMNQDLPYYFITPEENIILCGKVDWLEYLPEDDSVHVIDFKTGQSVEKEDSMQLLIYALLLKNCQRRVVKKASYWYLQHSDMPQETLLPDLTVAYERVIETARKVKKARQERAFACPRGEGGCYACRPFEQILRGEAEHVGVGTYNQDLYFIHNAGDTEVKKTVESRMAAATYG